MAREELKWQNIDADDLPAAVKKSFDAMVEAEATFKADLESLLKDEGHMPEESLAVLDHSRVLSQGDARRWPARHRRPLGYSSALCSRRRWRSRPMNHPITNAANRNAMITPMLTST
jgi:hypothetical protein